MEKKRSWGPGVVVIMAVLLVGTVLLLGCRSFMPTEEIALTESGQPAYSAQLLVVGLAVLIVLLASSYFVALTRRSARLLAQAVDAKTEELAESHERLRAALDRLEAAHAFLQSIMDGVAEPIMVIGTDYRVKLMNKAAREFTRGSISASVPLFCYQVSHHHQAPCEGTAELCPMERVRESGQPVTVVHKHHHASGEARYVEVIASPLWGADGSFQGIIEAVREVTGRMAAEGVLAGQAGALTSDELEQFSSKVIESIQGFFAKLPPES